MRRINIPAELERRLREFVEDSDPGYGPVELIEAVVKLLDAETERAAALKLRAGEVAGLGYKELVALFRSHLGDALLTPPKPSTPYVVRIINRAREMGVHASNVEQALKGARAVLRGGPYRLAELVYNYDKYYAAGVPSDGENTGSRVTNVHTGRPVLDDSGGG